jgi:hypothetical protein
MEKTAHIPRVETKSPAQRPHVAAFRPDLPEHPRLAERVVPSEKSILERPDALSDDAVESAYLGDQLLIHSLTIVREILRIKPPPD